MSLSGHVHHLPHLLAYMILSFLLMRSMMFGLGVGVVNELCTFTPSEKDTGGDEEGTENGKQMP